MNRNRKARFAVVLALLLCAAARTGAAQTAGSYGASFLKIPVGARLMASPDVVAGMRPDASLVYSNPAFIAGVENAGLFVSSSRWLDDLSFTSVGGTVPMGEGATVLGIGASVLYSGGLDGYDESLNVVDEQSFYDLGLDVAIGHRFGTSGLSAAIGASYVREHVLTEDGSGYAFHVGASYARGPHLLHTAARDLGGAVNFPSASWSIAPEWVAGAGRVFDSGVGQFFAGVDASSSDAYGTRLRFGVDYAVNGMFTLHTGVNESLEDVQRDSGFNAGFGMNFGALTVEYAYTPQEYFSSAHTFSLGYAFGTGAGMSHPGAVVPAGDLAPPVPGIASGAGLPDSREKRDTEFLLVAGAHPDAQSAEAEVRSLEQIHIPAEVTGEGPRFRVIVGRYSSFDAASQARQRYRARGHDFEILAR